MVAGYIGGGTMIAMTKEVREILNSDILLAMTGYWVGHTAQHLMLIKILTPMLCASYVFLIFESK